MNIAIVGSRSFTDYQEFMSWVESSFIYSGIDRTRLKIISGGAKGADSLAERYAKEYNIPFKSIVPDWDKYGKKAGFLRNADIVANCSGVIAFWDGRSKGTLHTIQLAIKAGKWAEIYPAQNKGETNDK